MTDWYDELVTRYPIWSLEDGLAEQDWESWPEHTERLRDRSSPAPRPAGSG